MLLRSEDRGDFFELRGEVIAHGRLVGVSEIFKALGHEFLDFGGVFLVDRLDLRLLIGVKSELLGHEFEPGLRVHAACAAGAAGAAWTGSGWGIGARSWILGENGTLAGEKSRGRNGQSKCELFHTRAKPSGSGRVAREIQVFAEGHVREDGSVAGRQAQQLEEALEVVVAVVFDLDAALFR